MLVYPTNPLGIELYYHANVFYCFGGKTWLLIKSVKTLYITSNIIIIIMIKERTLPSQKNHHFYVKMLNILQEIYKN